jgi:hypothetical protein
MFLHWLSTCQYKCSVLAACFGTAVLRFRSAPADIGISDTYTSESKTPVCHSTAISACGRFEENGAALRFA